MLIEGVFMCFIFFYYLFRFGRLSLWLLISNFGDLRIEMYVHGLDSLLILDNKIINQNFGDKPPGWFI